MWNKLVLKQEDKRYIFDYRIADVLLRLLTGAWLLSMMFYFHQMNKRPESIYEPILSFQQVFIPQFPSEYLFYSIGLLGVILSFLSIVKNRFWIRLVLLFVLLYVNAVQWGFGKIAHIYHLLILAHFFSLFLHSKRLTYTEANDVRWFQLGVLSTYTMAGSWKLLSLLYKLFFNPEAVHWLHHQAIELNAYSSHLAIDFQMTDFEFSLYEIPFVWEILTLMIFFVQFLAIFGAFRKKWSFILVGGLILFHLYNALFIHTVFTFTILVLLVLFFPYHLVFKKKFLSFQC